MHVTSRHSLVAAGLVSLGLLAPIATTATAVPAKPAPKAPRYVAEVMGPRAEPQPYGYGTSTKGIANSGDVLVQVGYERVLITNGKRRTALPPADEVTSYASAATITGSGDVYGTSFDGVVRWSSNTVSLASIAYLPDSNQAGQGLRVANNRGDVAGCVNNYRISWPFIGSFPRGEINEIPWPGGESRNCDVTGISNQGVVTLTMDAPNFPGPSHPVSRAATMTTAGVTLLKTPEKTNSRADAISPNGRLIAGRVFTDGNPTPVWLSHGRGPVALKGAGAMTPKVVTDKAVVFGEEKGRVVMWQAGRKTDLTKVSNLPRGWVLTSVSDINTRGQLAVTATIAARNETVAMRLTPRR